MKTIIGFIYYTAKLKKQRLTYHYRELVSALRVFTPQRIVDNQIRKFLMNYPPRKVILTKPEEISALLADFERILDETSVAFQDYRFSTSGDNAYDVRMLKSALRVERLRERVRMAILETSKKYSKQQPKPLP